MIALSYSFCLALLHSLWQAALLWLIYTGAEKSLIGRNHPLDKRNLLFITLLAQLALFSITFGIYYHSGKETTDGFAFSASALLPAENLQALAPWLFTAYISILCFRFIQALNSWRCFRNQYRPGIQKPFIELKLFTKMKAYQFGIKRKVTLWLSSTIQTPVTFGFFRPVIILPVALVNQISLQQAETLILHELTHIRTHDYLLNWFLVIMENIFFFNPFIRAIGKSVRLEREKNCDLGVLAFSYSPALYAETLLQAERIRQAIPDFSLAAAVQHKKQLLERISYFIKDNDPRQPVRYRLTLPSGAGLLFLLLIAASLMKPLGNHVIKPRAEVNETNNFPMVLQDAARKFTTEYVPSMDTKNLDFESQVALLMDKQHQSIEKKVKKMEPLLRSIEEKARKLAMRYAELNLVPVSMKESDSDIQEVIVREESSGTKASAVKVYRMVRRNGQWQIMPEWVATTKEIPTDSTVVLKKDSVKKEVLEEQ